MKIVIIGDHGVGKRKLIHSSDAFSIASYDTHGFQPYFLNRSIEDRKIQYQIWIVNPDERFDDVRKLYYNGSFGAIVIFDITRQETFLSVDKWIHEIWKGAGNDIPIVIMGNQKTSDIEAVDAANKVYEYITELINKEKEGVLTLRYVENFMDDTEGFEEALQHIGIEYYYYLEKKQKTNF